MDGRLDATRAALPLCRDQHGHHLHARMPRPDEREHLQIPPGVPVIDVLHTSLDQDGAAYEVTRFVLRADMNGLLYNTPVE